MAVSRSQLSFSQGLIFLPAGDTGWIANGFCKSFTPQTMFRLPNP